MNRVITRDRSVFYEINREHDLVLTEPFCTFTEEIEKAKARGEFDD